MVNFALFATVLGLAVSAVTALPTLVARQEVTQCGLTPENAGTRVCSLCRPLSVYAKTCTTTAITSCTRARLVLTGPTGSTSCVTACPAPLFADPQKLTCTCGPNAYLSDDRLTCVPSPTCSFNQYLALDKKTCVACTTLDPRALSCTATAVNTCSTGRVPMGTTCACPSTSYLSNGLCVLCTRLDSAAVSCSSRTTVTACANGLVPSGSKCVCPNTVTTRQGNFCVCPTAGDYFDGTQCSACGPSETSVNGACVPCGGGVNPRDYETCNVGEAPVCAEGITRDGSRCCPVGQSTCAPGQPPVCRPNFQLEQFQTGDFGCVPIDFAVRSKTTGQIGLTTYTTLAGITTAAQCITAAVNRDSAFQTIGLFRGAGDCRVGDYANLVQSPNTNSIYFTVDGCQIYARGQARLGINIECVRTYWSGAQCFQDMGFITPCTSV